MSIFYKQLLRISREVGTVLDARDSKINEICCPTAGVPRRVKKTGEQAEIRCKPREREKQQDLRGMPYILGYSVARKRASNMKDDLSGRPMA